MSCKVTNLSRRLVSFRGNSGQSWHLAPRTSIDVSDVEVSGNPKILKLSALHVIQVACGEPEQPEARPRRAPEPPAGPEDETEGKERSRRGK